MFNKLNNIEKIILGLFCILLPWSIIFASPQFHIGYWGQVEGMIVFSHFSSALLALFFINIGYKHKEFRHIFTHPLVLLPFLIGGYSVFSAFFQRLPVLSLYGSPQLGEGAFWYFSLALFTALYSLVSNNNKWKIILLLNVFLITFVISIGSFYPDITGIVFSFFGFYDWLALYFSACLIFIIYFLNFNKSYLNTDVLGLIFFLVLGPFFWIIENNAALALWVVISFIWFFWLLIFNLELKVRAYLKCFFTPQFFTLIPIILSIIIIASSFLFWDGTSDQTKKITNEIAGGHLATLISRGSIVRVLFEHLDNFQALLFGYGWGSISELLLSSFSPEVFYQINTGNRVHFHTHNELFEHIFSIGVLGGVLYIIYTYYVFKLAFKKGIAVAFAWLLYFCINAFWFQWISNIVIQAILLGLLIDWKDTDFNYYWINKYKKLFFAKLSFMICLFGLFLFMFYGAYIGFFTAYNHKASFHSNDLIEIAKISKTYGNCSKIINDYGKGGLQFSQKFNGYNNYYKDQVLLYGKLNESDYDVMEWHLCASNEMINKNKASIELINVHINALSMLSILPGELGIISREKNKVYMDLWEDKVTLLLSLAPKRGDQAVPLISYYFKNENDIRVKRICSYFDNVDTYQGFCDLALGAIFIKEGKLNKGLSLIKRASANGVLDSTDKYGSRIVDKETALYLKNLLKK